ncbi:MAG: hypothetical protein NVSMB59_23780 [Vulcanimicrobiaceae bacterium]
MYLNCVLSSVVLERANRIFHIGARVRAFASRWPIERRIAALPFWLFHSPW